MLRKGMFISDRYEVIDKVGSGGMSDVYKAKDHKLNRFVAIKVLKAEFSEDSGFVAKFRVEAQSAAGLSHPNIVNVFDVSEENGMYFIVMELIEGITLKKYIERKNQLPYNEAVSILIQVAQGIEAAHNNHIIHRDIKPQNIIISKEGKVKVTDFGIARAASSNTISSNAMGSVHYISPEQAKGGFIDEKSDIYSLGITLFEMLTGRVPFEGDSTVAIALQHVQNELPSPRIYAPDTPISVERIIEKCTQKKADRRYLKVSSLIVDLKQSLATPDEDFVKIATLDEKSPTRMISDEEVSRIRKESGFERQELEIPVINRNTEFMDDEDDYEDEDDLDLEGEENPKLDKIITIGGIITAAIILLIVIFVVIAVAGNGCSGSKKSASSNSETTLGANQTKVPDVAGKSLEDAIAALKENSLGYITKEENDDKIAAGYVISTSIDAGTVVEKNKTITLVVSKGPVSVQLADYTGKAKDDVVQALKDLGLTVTTQDEASDTVEFGKVIRTDPAAGTTMKSGDSITVYVSSADTESVEMPNVSGCTQNAAKAKLEGAGLKMGDITSEYSDTIETDKVIRGDYETGVKVAKGTTVNLVVSKGAEPKPTVPSIVGMTESDAKAALEAAGLTVGKVSSDYSDSKSAGQIISQSVDAGTSVEKGSAINYVVSLGKKATETTTKETTTTAAASSSPFIQVSGSVSTPDGTEISDGTSLILRVYNSSGTEIMSTQLGTYGEAKTNGIYKKINLGDYSSISAGNKMTVKVYAGEVEVYDDTYTVKE